MAIIRVDTSTPTTNLHITTVIPVWGTMTLTTRLPTAMPKIQMATMIIKPKGFSMTVIFTDNQRSKLLIQARSSLQPLWAL